MAECTLPTNDPEHPYILSNAAADRLESRCLTPTEFYRLVVRHGRTLYHLWPDFYGCDGEAYQAVSPVIRQWGDGIPNLDEVLEDLSSLMDFVIFNVQLDQKFTDEAQAMAALGGFGRAAVEEMLIERTQNATVNGPIQGACWDIRVRLGYVDAARLNRRWAQVAPDFESIYYGVPQLAKDSVPIVGAAATMDLILEVSERIRGHFAKPDDPLFVPPGSMAYYLRDCMGADMLLELVIALMERVPAGRFSRELLHTFTQFHDPSVLDWIEEHAVEPINYEWGTAAAVNGMSWERAKEWLMSGRPLSLIALDAMKNCRGFDKEDRNMSGVFKDHPPKIAGKPRASEVRDALGSYAKADSGPRVSNAIKIILANAHKIF